MMKEPPLTVLHVRAGAASESDGDPVVSLIEALSDRADVRQAAILPDGSKQARRAAAAGVQVRPVRWKWVPDGRAFGVLFAGCGEDWDVIHAHDGRAFRWTLLARALAGGWSPVLAGWETDDPTGRSPGKGQRADLVVTPSAERRAALIRRGLDRRRVEARAGAAGAATVGATGQGVERALRLYRVLCRGTIS